jgi:hypothetical protein
VTIAIDPRFMTVLSWAAQTTPILVAFGTVPKLQHAEDWRTWGRQVVMLPALAALGAPRPDPFPTWEAWANAFNVVLRLLKT